MNSQKNSLKFEDIKHKDIEILRELAAEISEIAQLPIHSTTIAEWKRTNDLKPGRPVVGITEVPWHEIQQCGLLQCLCENEFAKQIEVHFRTSLYMWHNAKVDMIVEPVYRLPIVIYDTGFGISSVAEYAESKSSGIVSRHFVPQIKDEKDIDKIKFPEISVDWEETEKRKRICEEIFGKYLNIELYGVGMIWFAPWDWLVMLVGVEETLLSLAARPSFARAVIERFLEANLYRLEQLEKMKVLSPNNGNFRIGSGGFGYTSDLSEMSFGTPGISSRQQWGCATSQIFSEVSPSMHKEFALNYEKKWLEKFGLSYYGCCEPLHNKIHILKEIENLRKISISPRADLKIAAEKIKNRYVISYKPNPAVFVKNEWALDVIKKELEKDLKVLKENGCIVEIIMKDISTISHEPSRLNDWALIATEVAHQIV